VITVNLSAKKDTDEIIIRYRVGQDVVPVDDDEPEQSSQSLRATAPQTLLRYTARTEIRVRRASSLSTRKVGPKNRSMTAMFVSV